MCDWVSVRQRWWGISCGLANQSLGGFCSKNQLFNLCVFLMRFVFFLGGFYGNHFFFCNHSFLHCFVFLFDLNMLRKCFTVTIFLCGGLGWSLGCLLIFFSPMFCFAFCLVNGRRLAFIRFLEKS